MKRKQDQKVVVSTMTATGKKHLLEKMGSQVIHFYLPLDNPLICQKAFSRLIPQKLIIAETEIWPGLIYTANLNKVPITIVNGRLSEKSMTSYLKIRFFIKNVLRKINKLIRS